MRTPGQKLRSNGPNSGTKTSILARTCRADVNEKTSVRKSSGFFSFPTRGSRRPQNFLSTKPGSPTRTPRAGVKCGESVDILQRNPENPLFFSPPDMEMFMNLSWRTCEAGAHGGWEGVAGRVSRGGGAKHIFFGAEVSTKL